MPKKVTRTLYKARQVIVNCKENDPADVRCGGSPLLGFEFYVDAEDGPNEICEFIATCLERYEIPLIGRIYVSRPNYEVHRLWSRRRMRDAMRRAAPLYRGG